MDERADDPGSTHRKARVGAASNFSNLAGPLAAGAAAAPAADAGGGEPISGGKTTSPSLSAAAVAPRQRGMPLCRSRDLTGFSRCEFECSVNQDNTVSFQNRQLADRAGSAAGG